MIVLKITVLQNPCGIKQTDFKSLDNFYNSVDWSLELEGLNVEDAWTKFTRIYDHGISRHVPYKDSSNGKKIDKQPWFRKKVKDAVRLKSIYSKSIEERVVMLINWLILSKGTLLMK